MEDVANIVFWTNTAVGLLIFLMLIVGVDVLAAFLGITGDKAIIVALAFQIPISSLSSVHRCLMNRDFQFRNLFSVKLMSCFTPAFFSIPLALYGFGAWALVASTLIGSFLELIMLWIINPWRPSFKYSTAIAKHIFPFSFWVMGESFCAWLMLWGDQLIVGKCLNISELGVYRVTCLMVMTIFSLFLNPMLPVIYPLFSRHQNNKTKLFAMFRKLSWFVTSISLPIGVGLFFTGPMLASLLFNDKYPGLGSAISVLGLAQGLSWSYSLNSEVYRSIGKPAINTKLMVSQLCYQIPAYLFMAQYGLIVFLWTRFMVTILALVINVYVNLNVLNKSVKYWWGYSKTSVKATCIMSGWLSFLALNDFGGKISNGALFLTITVATGATLYAFALWWQERIFWGYLLNKAKLLY